jgi:hypothetical protein
MPTKDRQFFTLEAANALVPRLASIVGKQLGRRAEIEERLKALAFQTGESPTDFTPPGPSDPPPVRELKQELIEKIGVYQQGWEAVEELGAVLKDPSIGLVDFYGHVDGKAVWLCWKFGEEQIAHYHSLDEGFSGRKPIGASLKRSLLN